MEPRREWISAAVRIAEPVLKNIQLRTLKQNLPKVHNNNNCYTLEAFARTLAGIAPWLELDDCPRDEIEVQPRFREMAKEGIDAITNPDSPDYVKFAEVKQGLVEAAHISHAILRAPKRLWNDLDKRVQKNLITELKATRKIKPDLSNWLLFSALIETLLFQIGEDYDPLRVDYALNVFEKWYLGDGIYGDGEKFHWDYYNSLVIQPMLIDIMRTLYKTNDHQVGSEHLFNGVDYGNFAKFNWLDLKEPIMIRARRGAEILERLISPEGTFPQIGRSAVYRFGSFHLLSQLALYNELDKSMSYGAVRCALTCVLNRMMNANGLFDENDWLRIGFYGYQPDLAEEYISRGSLYECCMLFPVLGAGMDHPFWATNDEDWTSKKIWSGQNIKYDKAILN